MQSPRKTCRAKRRPDSSGPPSPHLPVLLLPARPILLRSLPARLLFGHLFFAGLLSMCSGGSSGSLKQPSGFPPANAAGMLLLPGQAFRQWLPPDTAEAARPARPAVCAVVPSFRTTQACVPGYRPVWGFFAHRKINRMAVFTLPREMLRFYKNNLDYVTERAVAADKRRYVIEEEGARHYFDAERYRELLFAESPPDWEAAREEYGRDSLLENGILPWHIRTMMQRLTAAFSRRDSARILRCSADLGHYLADAHVPLHTTVNYNGQLTGQTGIHAFWESRLPELFSGEYDFWVGKARYLPDPTGTVWKILRESHAAVDSVLSTEARLSRRFPSDRKYTVRVENNRAVKDYSEAYSREYRGLLHGMVERRMRQSVLAIGSFWYTAWVNAGQPDLERLFRLPLSQAELKLEEKENQPREGAQMLGRKEH